MALTDVSYPGALPPPPGQTANFTHPDSIAPPIVLAAILFPIFTFLFCLLRLYTARAIVRKIYTDDCGYPVWCACACVWGIF